jgi:hypothetical protein
MDQRPGSAVGAVLRQLRTTRELTQATVARQALCSESMVSSVERGSRNLTPWLAHRLDQIYGTGNAITALFMNDRNVGGDKGEALDDVIVVHLPERGVTVPLSRRELLAAFGLGTVSGALLETLDRGLGTMRPTTETLSELRQTYDGFLAASRFSTSDELKDAIIGQIALVDAMRRRAPTGEIKRELTVAMARHAEAVSWLYEESFNIHQALYWIDRAVFWSQTVDWHDMVAFTFYRRSILAMNHADDGPQTIDLARHALRIPGTLPSVKGAAASMLSRGYARIGKADESARAMDKSIYYLSQPVDDSRNPALDQQSVVTDDSLALRQSASDLLLYKGESPIAALEPRLGSIGDGYQRNHNLSCARLALAYALAGESERSCKLAAGTLDALSRTPSLASWRELKRTTAILSARWPNRSDVREITASVESK